MKIARAIVIGMLVIISFTNISDAKVIKNKKSAVNKKVNNVYPSQVIDMANMLESRKNELGLMYRDRNDLLDTLNIIWKHTKKQSTFSFRQVVSIAIVESKLDHHALNVTDKGKGLLMVMPKYWRDKLPWYTNPYNKNQSARAGVEALNIIQETYKCSSWTAIRYYNSRSSKSIAYLNRVKRIHSML